MANIYIETGKEIKNGQEVTLLVKLNTEGKTINSIDGTLELKNFSKDVLQIHTGGSAFTLWPDRPSLVGETVSFVGGVPSGVDAGDALLFTIVLKSDQVEKAYIAFKNITAYVNDTNLSTVSVKGDAVKLTEININNSNTISSISEALTSDTIPPLPFSIELGQDPSLFDGKYFISFSTTDANTGINRYEVQEGSGLILRSGTTYQLQDQTLQSRVTVRAIDNAGNVQIATLEQVSPVNWYFVVLISMLALLVKNWLKKK